jgi:energy-coupling factor transporter transmembrane protein EcfT
MKKPFILLLSLLTYSVAIFSQEVIRQQSCTNEMMSKQADSLKNLYAKDGFVLLKEASITMAVIVPLTQGSWYQFVFIGDYSSKLYEVRMFDWNERQVIFQQKRWGDVDGNVISYSYIPKFSEYHMMKPVQVNKQKKKNLCGYVMLFKKAGENTNQQSGPLP